MCRFSSNRVSVNQSWLAKLGNVVNRIAKVYYKNVSHSIYFLLDNNNLIVHRHGEQLPVPPIISLMNFLIRSIFYYFQVSTNTRLQYSLLVPHQSISPPALPPQSLQAKNFRTWSLLRVHCKH